MSVSSRDRWFDRDIVDAFACLQRAHNDRQDVWHEIKASLIADLEKQRGALFFIANNVTSIEEARKRAALAINQEDEDDE